VAEMADNTDSTQANVWSNMGLGNLSCHVAATARGKQGPTCVCNVVETC